MYTLPTYLHTHSFVYCFLPLTLPLDFSMNRSCSTAVKAQGVWLKLWTEDCYSANYVEVVGKDPGASCVLETLAHALLKP